MARHGKDSNIFEILITIDNHIDFYENQHLMSDYSFNLFEKTFLFANELNADFFLLSSDLFDELHPTQLNHEKASEIFNRQVFNSKEN